MIKRLFYQPFWFIAWGITLGVSAGGWLAQPANILETLIFLAIQAGLALVFVRWFKQAPDHVTGIQMLVALALSLAFTLYSSATWQRLGIHPLPLLTPYFLGITVAWGWTGVLLNTVMALVLPQLFSNTQPALLFFLVTLHNILGITLHYFFRRYEARHNELERSVSTDMLTKIGNRRALLEDFTKFQATAQKQGLPLLLTSWDVDGLKRINDSKGHQAGDEYILSFVKALNDTVRTGDGLYRTGGDEFVGLHLGLASGGKLYERIRELFPHVSGGWSRATNISLDQALTEADVQMYAEKRVHKAKITRIIGESQMR